MLLGNHKIVRISKEPGCTRSINYYAIMKDSKDSNYKDSSNISTSKDNIINDMDRSHLLYLIDLPGYGFAKISKKEQKKWQDMIISFLTSRNQSILRYDLCHNCSCSGSSSSYNSCSSGSSCSGSS